MQIFVGAGKREYVPLEERSVVEGPKKNPSPTIHSGYVWSLQTNKHCHRSASIPSCPWQQFFSILLPAYSQLMSYCAGFRREQCWRHTRTNHRQNCNVDSILWGRLLCIWPISWITKQDGCSTWKRWYNQFGNIWIIFGCTSLSNTFPFFSPSSSPRVLRPSIL